MTARSFTDEQEQEIAARYGPECSAALLAKEYGTSERTIKNALERQGKAINSDNRRFTDEQEEEIAARYSSNCSVSQLAEEYGANRTTIRDALKRQGKAINDTRRKLTDEQEQEIARRYGPKCSTIQLAEEYGVSASAIRNALKRQGKAIINSTAKKLTDEQEREAAARYGPGCNTYQLAEEYGVSVNVIINALRRQGKAINSTNRKFADEQEREIAARYGPECHTVQLAKEYGVSATAIARVLKRQGKAINSPRRFTDEQEQEVAARYGPGCSTVQLAKEYGVSVPTIRDALKRQGVTPQSFLVADRAEALAVELEELILALGDHIHDLPMKSRLAIISKVKGLQDIGPNSALDPIRIGLLSGRIGPANIVPPTAARPAGGAAPTSSLREELNKILQGLKPGDIDEPGDEIGIEGGPGAAPPIVPVDLPLDDQARLLNLTPQQRLATVSAVAKACTDEGVIRRLVHNQNEMFWTQLFTATDEEATALVAQMQAVVPADAWAALVRDSFLADHRLIEEIGEIPGLVLPEGMTLNLMQRREAALLLRDRRRLNLSGCGAGKTLSAIAGAQLLGVDRALVICPNNAISTWQAHLSRHLPHAAVAAKTWHPVWQDDDCPKWLIVNHEMLADRAISGMAMFLAQQDPQFVVIDELHDCKMSSREAESQRHRNLAEMSAIVRGRGHGMYGMTGTLVPNHSGEAISQLALIDPDRAKGLSRKRNINAFLDIHEALQPISTRYVPPPAAKVVNRRIDVRADHLLDDLLAVGRRGLTAADAVLAKAKIDALVTLAEEPGKLVVFTSAVTGVVAETQQALKDAGIGCAIFTGKEKLHGGRSSTEVFASDPSVKVLLATTECLSAGFDGLQKAAGRLAFLTLPWTPAKMEQATGRVVRQGTVFAEVEVTVFAASLADPLTGDDWSLDQQKLDRLTSKRTAGDSIVDGVIPDAEALKAFSEAAVRKTMQTWMQGIQQQRQQQEAAQP